MRHLSLLHSPSYSPVVEQPGTGFHVLLADDGEFSRRLTRHRLQQAGFRVTFSDGATLGEPIHAIVCAWDMFVTLGEIPPLDHIFVVVTVDGKVSDAHRELGEMNGAAGVVCSDEVVDGLLEALWERTSASAARSPTR